MKSDPDESGLILFILSQKKAGNGITRFLKVVAEYQDTTKICMQMNSNYLVNFLKLKEELP